MKIGKKKLKLHTGKVIEFDSEEKRDRYERYVQAIKHGWKPSGKKK